MMPRSFRTIAETALSVVTGTLAVATVFWRDWIEVVFGLDPDGGSGSVEWLIIATLAGLSLACATTVVIEIS